MFDIGFSELLLFGVIALIVLGPEKLPKAARSAGRWYAKLRRTVATLQSEMEAEFDLAETRQQMQDEIAKIRQTEADMRREMAEMRGSLKDFEHSQNKSIKATHKRNSHSQPNEFIYTYNEDKSDTALDFDDENDTDNSDSKDILVQPILTRPWENMWFRLSAYDKARRLPAPPYLANYTADVLLNVDSESSHLNNISVSKTLNRDSYLKTNTSLHKPESEQ